MKRRLKKFEKRKIGETLRKTWKSQKESQVF